MEEVGTHTIEITEFVPAQSVDPVYFDKAYYLAPDKGGAKPMRCSHRRCAIPSARLWSMGARGKQYIVMLRPVEKAW
jgi:DNA end-binding protein Ku